MGMELIYASRGVRVGKFRWVLMTRQTASTTIAHGKKVIRSRLTQHRLTPGRKQWIPVSQKLEFREAKIGMSMHLKAAPQKLETRRVRHKLLNKR